MAKTKTTAFNSTIRNLPTNPIVVNLATLQESKRSLGDKTSEKSLHVCNQIPHESQQLNGSTNPGKLQGRKGDTKSTSQCCEVVPEKYKQILQRKRTCILSPRNCSVGFTAQSPLATGALPPFQYEWNNK